MGERARSYLLLLVEIHSARWHCLDFQNRVGSKFGGGGVAGASETNVDRRERLRKLALETIDLAKVPPSSISLSLISY
jgi:hypothetical protein